MTAAGGRDAPQTLLFTVVKARPVKTSRCLFKIKSNKEVRYKHVSCDSEKFKTQKMLQNHINRQSGNDSIFPLKIKDFPSFMLVDIWSRNLDQYSFLWSKLRESGPRDASKKYLSRMAGLNWRKVIGSDHNLRYISQCFEDTHHSSSNIDIWYIQTLISSLKKYTYHIIHIYL